MFLIPMKASQFFYSHIFTFRGVDKHTSLVAVLSFFLHLNPVYHVRHKNPYTVFFMYPTRSLEAATLLILVYKFDGQCK